MKVAEILLLSEAEEEIKSRMIPLSDDTARKLIKKNCHDNLKTMVANNSYLYRGSIGQNVVLMDSASATRKRKSANVPNWCNLFLANDPSWKAYPKRDESFVCSSDLEYAYDFGEDKPYVVIPYDDTKLGICPTYDIFSAFLPIAFPELARIFTRLASLLSISGPTNPEDWDTMKYCLAEIDDVVKEQDDDVLKEFINDHFKSGSYFREQELRLNFIQLLLKHTPTMKIFQKYLGEPKRHGFTLKTTAKFPAKREIWFSGKAVGIRGKERFDEITKEIQ